MDSEVSEMSDAAASRLLLLHGQGYESQVERIP